MAPPDGPATLGSFTGPGSVYLCEPSRRHRLSLERRNLDGMHQLYMIDLFHTLVNIPRYRFILVFLGAYISMYCTFALVYLFFSDGGRCISKVESFYHALWFSVHTSSTIGYGHMAPNPDCVGANLVTMGQTLCTILLQATLLGVMFSRFSAGSRRSAAIEFSRVMTCRRDAQGNLVLSLRVANLRRHQILRPRARLLFLYRGAESGPGFGEDPALPAEEEAEDPPPSDARLKKSAGMTTPSVRELRMAQGGPPSEPSSVTAAGPFGPTAQGSFSSRPLSRGASGVPPTAAGLAALAQAQAAGGNGFAPPSGAREGAPPLPPVAPRRLPKFGAGDYVYCDLAVRPAHGAASLWLGVPSTLEHVADAHSALHGLDRESLSALDAEFVALLDGIDESTRLPVQARRSYFSGDIRWNEAFVPLLHREISGNLAVNFGEFHATHVPGRAAALKAEGGVFRSVSASASELGGGRGPAPWWDLWAREQRAASVSHARCAAGAREEAALGSRSPHRHGPAQVFEAWEDGEEAQQPLLPRQ